MDVAIPMCADQYWGLNETDFDEFCAQEDKYIIEEKEIKLMDTKDGSHLVEGIG